MSHLQVVSEADWAQALGSVRAQEKRATRERDALAAARRRLPAVAIHKPYVLQGPEGEVGLADLFEGRRQLLLYHFMFAPGVHGWPEAGCPGCSMFVDQIGGPEHFYARDTSLVLISRAPVPRLEAYAERMGWSIPWYSSEGSDFNRDFGITREDGEHFGLSVLIRDGDRVLRSYFTDQRGVEALGSVWTFLDLTPLGRQEDWEDSPDGVAQVSPYAWWRRHDEYGAVARSGAGA